MAHGFPDLTGKVPKVHGFAVCDEECLAGDLAVLVDGSVGAEGAAKGVVLAVGDGCELVHLGAQDGSNIVFFFVFEIFPLFVRLGGEFFLFRCRVLGSGGWADRFGARGGDFAHAGAEGDIGERVREFILAHGGR